MAIAGTECPPDDPTAPPSGQPLISRVIPDTVSVCDPEFVLTVRGAGFREVKAVALGTIPAAVAEVEPRDGSTIAVTVKNDQALKKIDGMEQLTLMVRTAFGLATIPVRVQAGKCP